MPDSTIVYELLLQHIVPHGIPCGDTGGCRRPEFGGRGQSATIATESSSSVVDPSPPLAHHHLPKPCTHAPAGLPSSSPSKPTSSVSCPPSAHSAYVSQLLPPQQYFPSRVMPSPPLWSQLTTMRGWDSMHGPGAVGMEHCRRKP